MGWKAIGGGGGLAHTWAGFSPTWGASGVAPALGNATVTTRQTQQGDLVHVAYHYVFGSTTTYGTGNYTWTLPVNANLAANFAVGFVRANDTGSLTLLGIASLVSVSAFEIHGTNGEGKFGQTVPFTWTDGDKLFINVTYEAA